MTIAIDTAGKLRTYTDGVRAKANHHARNVDAIWPCVLGYVMAYARKPLPFEARGQNGEIALQGWAEFPQAGRLSFSYRRKPTARIAVCKGSIELAAFTNTTTALELQAFFQGL